MQRLTGKIAVITGAAAGIGLSVAETFAREGARLALIDRNDAVVDVAGRLGPDHRGYVADLGDDRAIEVAFSRIARDFSTVHILVNNAGIGLMAPAEALSTADWDTTMRINLRAPFLCARSVAPLMLRQKWGRIVTISSQAAVIGIEHHAAYSASKAGLLGMTNCLALEWGPFGITANCVSPTVVETELGKTVWSGEKGDRARAEIPTRRFAQPVEVAEAVLYLASDGAAMVNGANLMLDGGNTIR
jgi:NAD(P)-dependent dehydrogenase (short-subunit alcohol dehydrogenase family)